MFHLLWCCIDYIVRAFAGAIEIPPKPCDSKK